MRYFRVSWIGTDGARQLSDPLPTWLDAAAYCAALADAGTVPTIEAAEILRY